MNSKFSFVDKNWTKKELNHVQIKIIDIARNSLINLIKGDSNLKSVCFFHRIFWSYSELHHVRCYEPFFA